MEGITSYWVQVICLQDAGLAIVAPGVPEVVQ